MATGAVIAIQDMGAAGLTCTAVDMGAKGDLGIELNLDAVPVREERMTPYEMMLSESQERMLMVLHPEKEAEARAVFEKWELDFATVGITTDDLRFRVMFQGEEVANLPIKELGDEAPEYDRPWVAPTPPAPLDPATVPDADIADALLKLLGSANHSSRRWVYEQYDTLIQGNSLQTPGGDSGVIRVEGHPTKALSFSSDVNPRYCEADPYEGGKQAVAECWRNLIATGAEPLAATDNLNFGNPERPEIMGQIVHAIKGIGEACTVLEFPIVSGNVSLYNETNGRGILPTPTIAGVGLIEDHARMARSGFAREGDAIILIGAPEAWGTHLGQSAYLRDVLGRREGTAPHVDLDHEKQAGHYVLSLIRSGRVNSVHDLSDGGLALALAESSIKGSTGASIQAISLSTPSTWFGEDQGRYIVTTSPQEAEKIVADAPVSAVIIGTTGGDTLTLGNAKPISIKDLRDAHEGWFPAFMGATIA
jgi:phosphoribosylformylglycinamidine synthase